MRHVSLVGQWHLLIDHGDWEIRTETSTITSLEFDDASLRLCLEDLDGQYLISAAPGPEPASCVLAFDLGGSIRLRPAGSSDGEQWFLFGPGGLVIACRDDGRLVTDDRRGV